MICQSVSALGPAASGSLQPSRLLSRDIEGNPFNGTIKGVQIDLKLTDADHVVSDAERWRVAMAIQ